MKPAASAAPGQHKPIVVAMREGVNLMVVNTIPYDADKEDTGTFWMVYIQGATATVVEHLSFESAMAEASRLCRKENKQVYVLEVNGLCIPGEPIWRPVASDS